MDVDHCSSGISVTLTNEISDPRVGFRQSLLVRQKYDAEVLGARFLAEPGAVHDHDVLPADEFLDENLIALRNVDSGVSVERASGLNATHARGGFAPFLCEIAAGTKLALHFDEMILRSFERGFNGVLLGMVGA